MLTGKRDLVLVGGMIVILVILFTPIPPAFLDFLLIINLSLAMLILLLTFYTDKPLSFSTFPSLLLIATLFRLALNVSATRLILDGADAGEVIHSIGAYVVGGNYVIGLVVFLILVVVQYVVVTNGAQRVAEVAARFTLDSMPGKQMSIDADMNMGIIDEKEAKSRRAMIEKEANFYGAMDGATKFVKGDAIAGIVIILIDIIGGLSVGIAQMGMSWGEALQTYTLLTVGDGIVTQIPSLVIATATGIIITRAATDSHLGDEMARQIMGHPKTLVIVALALLGLLLLPGLPSLPVLSVLAIFIAGTVFAYRSAAKEDKDDTDETSVSSSDESEDLYEMLQIHPLEIRTGRSLNSIVDADSSSFISQLKNFRKHFALDMGFVIPEVRIQRSTELGDNEYEVFIHDTRVGNGTLQPDRLLAIQPTDDATALEGIETHEPTYGLPAKWIDRKNRQLARSANYTLVEPETVLLTHFSETIRRNAADLLTRSETERLVGRVGNTQQGLIEELVPSILSYTDIQKVFQGLLREKVSIRNIEAILEILVDKGKESKDPVELCERARERLGGSICQGIIDSNGDLHVLTLAPDLERQMIGNIRQSETMTNLFPNPDKVDLFIQGVAQKSEEMMSNSRMPVLLCPGMLRRHMRQLLRRALPHLSIIGLNELPENARVRSFGIVDVGNPS